MDVVVAGAKAFVGGVLGGIGKAKKAIGKARKAGQAVAAAIQGKGMNKLNGMLPGPAKQGIGLVQSALADNNGKLPPGPPGMDTMGQ